MSTKQWQKEYRKKLASRPRDTIVIPETKKCCKCKVTKPSNEFHHSIVTSNGLNPACKSCTAEFHKERSAILKNRTIISIPDTKLCGHCRLIKPSIEFCKVTSNNDGLAWGCRTCEAITAKKSRRRRLQENPVRERLRKMLYSAKERAKKNNVSFDLAFDWLLNTFGHLTHCPAIGIELDWQTSNGHVQNSPSLDKIIPELGYTKPNVQVISYKANTMKNSASLLEWKAFCQWSIQIMKKIESNV